MNSRISRRTILRGCGAAVALPLLEAMPVPFLHSAQGAEQAPMLPQRLMFVYVPNGAIMKHWTPQQEGADFQLPQSLEPLEKYRQNLLVISGLAHRNGEENGDGPGDHARASASYLTGAQPRKTASVDIRAGVSVDQVAAGHLGRETRLASLELGCDKGRQAGACDSGYSCAYQFNLAWKTPSLPLPPEVDPRLAFERLFGAGRDAADATAGAERLARRRSVLDFVRQDTARLRAQVSGQDARKLEQFLDGVREVEQRIERATDERATLPPGADPIDEIPEDYARHIRLMYDLAALAFQTDSTRVITLMIAHDGSNRSYPTIGVPDGHHDLSHHGGNQEKITKIAKIDRFHVEQFAYFLEKLEGISEHGTPLVNQCLIAYGSGLSDGNAHHHRNLPILVAGSGSRTVKPGRHLKYAGDTPMCNLFLSLLERVGVRADRFGDSTGVLEGLS